MSQKNNKVFGKKLRSLRNKSGITMLELSKRVNISNSYISMLESGDRQPSRDVVVKLAESLFPEGRDELLILAGFSPVNPDVHFSKAHDTVSICQRALEGNEKDFTAYMALLIALIKSGQYEIAKEKIHKGFQLFDHSIQWHALFSILELIKGNYEGAIMTQQTAIDYYQLESDTGQIDVDLADLLKNLGVIHFLKGSELLSLYLEADYRGDTKKALQDKSHALQNFKTAKGKYHQALEISPNNVYILDEYARVSFNLAFLAPLSEADTYWQETIRAFKEVIYSENRQDLGHEHLLEANAFLAHAYTKKGDFEQAEYTIHLIASCCPDYWLIDYVRACFYNLRYDHNKSPDLLDKSLCALQQAVCKNSQNNRATHYALKDPDLKTVREIKPEVFSTILNLKEGKQDEIN